MTESFNPCKCGTDEALLINNIARTNRHDYVFTIECSYCGEAVATVIPRYVQDNEKAELAIKAWNKDHPQVIDGEMLENHWGMNATS